MNNLLTVRVWGDWACFTRPEMKVERVSYEAMTPAAARAILRSIFWKPEFRWEIRRIDVLKPIRRFSILRNEVKSKAAVSTVKKWAENDGHFFADQDRTQRHALILRDVAYVIHAGIWVKPHAKREHPAKFRDQFRRRVGRGQCYSRPYLGNREFSAYFGEPSGREQPIERTEDLGRMLFDIDYEAGNTGRGKPVFFQARLERGVLHVPEALHQRFRRED